MGDEDRGEVIVLADGTTRSGATVRAAGEDVVSPDLARATLLDVFGALLDEEYLPGKTKLRDALCERLDLDVLDAEIVCDELEAAGIVRFVSCDEGHAWRIESAG